jgi:hypothetical protein
MHIKSQGLDATGNIHVKPLSMEVTSNVIRNKMFDFAGGLYSGVIFIFIGIILGIVTLPFGWIFIMVGLTNFVYGIFEGKYLPKWGNNNKFKVGRYSIYIFMTLIMSLIGWYVIP